MTAKPIRDRAIEALSGFPGPRGDDYDPEEFIDALAAAGIHLTDAPPRAPEVTSDLPAFHWQCACGVLLTTYWGGSGKPPDYPSAPRCPECDRGDLRRYDADPYGQRSHRPIWISSRNWRPEVRTNGRSLGPEVWDIDIRVLLTAFLDARIREWRARRDDAEAILEGLRNPDVFEPDGYVARVGREQATREREMASHYIDAFDLVRIKAIGEPFPLDDHFTPRDLRRFGRFGSDDPRDDDPPGDPIAIKWENDK